MIKAVFWDFGGVILSSPFEAFNRYELQKDIPTDFIRRVNSTNPNDNAWAAFESNAIDLAEFDKRFLTESTALGHAIPGADIIALLSGEVRPRMVAALKKVNDNFITACLTNNVKSGKGPGMQRDEAKAAEVAKIMAIFDGVIESSKVGCRKPQPEFYELACQKMQVEAADVVFLDDLGINLKPAAAMGMKTIKVVDPDVALQELAEITGLVFD